MKLSDLVPWRTRELSRQSGENPVNSFRRELNHLFDDFFTEPLSANGGGFSPGVDVSETDTAIEVKAELPGMDEKDVEVLLGDNTLTLRGEKKDESERTEEGVRIRENSYGRFERVIPLPAEVEAEKVNASFKKGVITVVLPKTEKAKQARRKIEVTS